MIGTELSICKSGWLHRFILLRQSPEFAEEGCVICKKKAFYKVVRGRIDNLAYLKTHIRQALPPFHSLYYREYPKPKNYED